MFLFTAEAPTGENSISQAIRHKHNNIKGIKLRNTAIRCYGTLIGCVMTSPVIPYRYWQCCLPVRHTSQLHGGSRPPSHVYQVTNCSHFAYRTQTTKSCSQSLTVRCRSVGWGSRSELRGTGEIVIVCKCKRSSAVRVRSQINPVNILPPNDPL